MNNKKIDEFFKSSGKKKAEKLPDEILIPFKNKKEKKVYFINLIFREIKQMK